MTTHSSILAWKSPWTEVPAGHSPWGYKEEDMTEWLSISATTYDVLVCRASPRILTAPHEAGTVILILHNSQPESLLLLLCLQIAHITLSSSHSSFSVVVFWPCFLHKRQHQLKASYCWILKTRCQAKTIFILNLVSWWAHKLWPAKQQLWQKCLQSA